MEVPTQAKYQSRTTFFLFCDLEMTKNEDPITNKILEIAIILSSPHFHIYGTYHAVIHHPPPVYDLLSDWCKEQHTASGLMKEVNESKKTIEMAEKEVLEFLKEHLPPSHFRILLVGTGISHDQRFLAVHMPRLHAKLEHQPMEIATIIELSRYWHTSIHRNQPRRIQPQHRAMADIQSSYQLLYYYRHVLWQAARSAPVQPFFQGTNHPHLAPGEDTVMDHSGGTPGMNSPGFSSSFHAPMPFQSAQNHGVTVVGVGESESDVEDVTMSESDPSLDDFLKKKVISTTCQDRTSTLTAALKAREITQPIPIIASPASSSSSSSSSANCNSSRDNPNSQSNPHPDKSRGKASVTSNPTTTRNRRKTTFAEIVKSPRM